MKTFILFAALWTGHGSGATSNSFNVEFSSLEKCEAAKLKIEETFSHDSWNQRIICVEK